MNFTNKVISGMNVIMMSLLLLTSAMFQTTTATEVNSSSCANASLDTDFNISVPCLGVDGLKYQAQLEYAGNDNGVPAWKVEKVGLSDCAWNYQSCGTLGSEGVLSLLNFELDGTLNDATLQKIVSSHDQNIYFKYLQHKPAPTQPGHSDSQGSLSPFQSKTAAKSTHKLIAIYMVGSDLENSWNQAATLDLKELIQGYQALAAPEMDVIVAFGGANKDGWRGMTIANMQQLIADAEDGQFGNSAEYLYREPLAHMGDSSSLELFLDALKKSYESPKETFLAFWDHGGAYNGFGMDENYNNDSLSLQEIQKALLAGGQHFNLIGFDACLMGSAEVANYLNQSADYLLSSEEIEPGHGWNWQNMVALFAANEDLVTRAKNMIDSYIDNANQPYNSTGKTLSLVDLSQFNTFKAQTNAFLDGLDLNLRENVSTVIDAAATALNRTRTFTENYHISIDLLDFILNILSLADNNNPAEAQLITSINALIDATERYVLYSRHDGTRPYSYGVSINPPDNKPAAANLSENQNALQQIWQQLVADDDDRPAVSDQQNAVSANQANISDTTFTEADLLALQGVINQLLSSGTISQAQYALFLQGLDVLKKPDLTAEEKLLELEQIENNSRGVIPRGIFARGIYARGIYARGIAPKGIIARGITARKIAARKISARSQTVAYRDTLPFLKGERAAFVYRGNGIKARDLTTSSNVKGTIARFTDSRPLSVKTIYGTVRTDAKTQDQLFETVAELDAYPTENPDEYFTPSWNRVWYNVTFDDQQPSQWMPLRFEKRYRENDQTLTVYSSQLQYQDGNKSYPDLAASGANKALCTQKGYIIDSVNNCVEQAVLELVINENNAVVSHKVTPFKQLFQDSNDAQGFIVFDKVSNELKAGDKIRFLFETANLTTGETGSWGATTRDEFIIFKRTPTFGTELLAFVNKDTGEVLDFYYTMRARDISGKSTTATPQIAPVDLPNCEKLLSTQQDLHAVGNYLADDTKRIQFNSDLGNRFDEANATLLTIDEALKNAVLSDKVTRLINVLYNPATLDEVNSTWVWDRVDFSVVKTVTDAIIPDIDQVYQQNCQ